MMRPRSALANARGGRVRGIRVFVLVAIGIATACSASAQTLVDFRDSAYRTPIPDAPPCDVIITKANAATTLFLLDDPRYRSFCITPGDYRGVRRRLILNSSGTQSAPRHLRFAAFDGLRAIERGERAIVEAVHIFGSWWVIQGLTVLPRDPDTEDYIGIYGGDHNIIDGNLVDGIQHPNVYPPTGIEVTGYYGNPGNYNSVQANVVRNGDQTRTATDYDGIAVREGSWPGENNSYNRVTDNEVSDWGDGVTVSGHRDDCAEPGMQYGTIVDNNDIYLTSNKRVDCATAAPNPNGACACAENGIDVKAEPGPLKHNWTRLTNNRIWGYRPTPAVRCGGSGAEGQGVTAGNACAGHVLVAHNIIQNSSTGLVTAGSDWIVASNLFHDIRFSSGRPDAGQIALWPGPKSSNVEVQFNTIVGVDDAYSDSGPNVDTRCNAVIDNRARHTSLGGVRAVNHTTAYNFLYASPRGRFLGNTNSIFASAADSGNAEYCYWRRRWTAPELVCIPYGATTSKSPHRLAVGFCDEDLLADFGIPKIGFPASAPGCGLGAEVALVLPLLRRWQRRTRS